MIFDYETVPIENIWDEDTTYRISTDPLPQRLKASIADIGLITPPLLKQQGHRYIIVSGFRRVAICRMLEWEHMPAACLTAQVSNVQSALMAIADNATQRDLNIVELARACCLLDNISQGHGVQQLFLSAGLDINPDLFAKLKRINQMPPVVQRGLIDQTIALPIALRLDEHNNLHVIEALSHLLCELNLSLNRQRELLDWIEAIAKRDKLSVTEVLNDEPLEILRQDSTLDPGHKTNLIRHYFKQRRYPNIIAFERNYQQCAKTVKLPKGVALTPPPHFEGRLFTFKICFEDQDQLSKLIENLKHLVKTGALNKLIETARP